MNAPPAARSAELEEPSVLDMEAVLAAVSEAAYSWSIRTDRLLWSSNVCAVLGVQSAIALDSATGFASLIDPDALSTRASTVLGSSEADTGEGVPYEVEYPVRRGGGRIGWVQDSGRWFGGPDGRPVLAVGVVRPLGGQYEASQKAALLARFDPMTGQLSRTRLLETASAALAEARRLQSGCAFALIAIVNLAEINDAYGLDVGDEVITGISRRLRSAMRGGDALGRFSSSTFGLILRRCETADLAVAGRRFLDAVHSAPITTTAGPVAARLAVGGVIAPRYARSAEEMVLRARDALAEARHARGAAFDVYRPDSAREVFRRNNLRLADDLLVALNERRLHLALQPVVHSGTRQVAWREALLRVQCADGTMISGGPLVRAAEDLGLISLVDHRVLELALQMLATKRCANIAINVSAATTIDHGWLEALEAQMRVVPDASHRLHIEITETAAIADLEATRAFVARLKTLGIKVAIDDFGTGHTSFKALRRLGVDLVKIDGSFVADLDRSSESRAFVRALTALARELGLESVAEQVETEAAAEMLTEFGVTYLQGDCCGRPEIEISGGERRAV
jgi:diguanylate cyclase (GGDEF)-like protein